MLSGNGRHRRPRQAPALLVAAGVTGSAIAIPLLGASGASAADGTTWDRVADCETGGAWSQNSGNGYYGGLQLSQDDWEKHGGLDYAASADLASRSQQIAVAERILADQGVGAWRTCGLLSGLQQEKGSESSGSSESSGEVDSPGLLDSLGSSPSESPSSSPSPDASSSSKDETAKTGKSRKSGGTSQDEQPDGSPSATPEGGKPGDSQQGDDSSASAETGSGRHRGPSADETRAPESDRAEKSTGRHSAPADESSGDASEGAYIVGIGDSLWSIADALRVSGGWHALYEGNENEVGADPDLIHPGQTLTVEGEADER
ncbi:transglycosylase family protein [Streptomyces violaceochromogenes]|uniref:Transglycosylase family protein n=1 Tax=Streptomyces violaceochromogenes TaxID=67377 RepID=A0ABU6LY86_9ACTN|nr:transglycosylase family protein [Streptomyces violaceochromogenes]MEC7054437.1 transglycosylase family protein [Streptomyces violaceochromogenes]GHC78499.1 peptidoglycan-binding protein LysM [Streptomyces violaceochromogenes]